MTKDRARRVMKECDKKIVAGLRARGALRGKVEAGKATPEEVGQIEALTAQIETALRRWQEAHRAYHVVVAFEEL